MHVHTVYTTLHYTHYAHLQLDQNLMSKFTQTPQYTAACAEQQQLNAMYSSA
jgi:hypothetical protein